MDSWDLMTDWALVIPPSRPSTEQLLRTKAQIKNVDRSLPVAILGSTPELRDLLFECGFRRIHIMERNLNFYQSMDSLRVHHNEEELILGDWLDTLPGLSAKFAVILSDLTSGNIPYESRTRFYELVANALSPGGLFCDKVLTHPGEHIALALLEAKYAHLPLNLIHINYFSCEVLFCSELLDISSVVNSTLFYSVLEDRLKDARARTFAKLVRKITPPGLKWWYGRKWDQLSQDYCKQLRLLSENEDEQGSPYFGRLKHFLHVREQPGNR